MEIFVNKFKITYEGDCVLVQLGDKELEVIDYSEENILLECDLECMNDVNITDVPENITIRVHNSTGFDTYLFYEIELSKFNGSTFIDFLHHFPNKYWEGKWGQRTYLLAIQEQVKYYSDLSVEYIEVDDDWKAMTLRWVFKDSHKVADCIEYGSTRIKELIKQAEIMLGGITWIEDYEKNEDKFCRDILAPLLRRMGFLSVRYTHGKKEYGKDFTFSELTSFGDLRHYGLQAKAGNVNGRVNSDIDELIGQINDAFFMPYYELGSKDPRYISNFIIAISGHFTENAREKIVEKIPKGVIGAVYFLDKEKVTELIERYWVY